VVKLLLIWDDINLNSKNKFGATPLLLAAKYKNKVIVELLLTQDNVNPNPKSVLKNIPLL